MRIGSVIETIVQVYRNEKVRMRPLYLEGPSGIGKSECVAAAARELDIALLDKRLSTADPNDFGMQMPVNNVLVPQKPDFIAYMEQHPEGGIFFLDEITSAVPAIQAPAYQVTNDRVSNGFLIPDNWMIILAGNRISDRGVTYLMAAPLLNRVTRIELDTTLDDVLEEAARRGIAPIVMAFLKNQMQFLHKFNGAEYNGEQFPTPRGWFAVSAKLDLPVSTAIRTNLIIGDVGREAGTTFEQFMRIWETMPDIDMIFTDPDKVEVPDKLDVRYCVAMGLAARLDKKNFNTAWEYIQRLPQELQVLIGKLAYTRDNDVAQASLYSEWVQVNASAFERF